MPNVDFERRLLSQGMAKAIASPDFARNLLAIKALIDFQNEDTLTLNFMDTLRPELWCVEGLARHLEPIPGRHYGLDQVEKLPKTTVHFENALGKKTAWVLYVEVNSHQDIVDDGYFFKKVRDQLGFGSSQQLDVSIMPGMQREIAFSAGSDDDNEALPVLALSRGMNTVSITALDARIATWLFFTFACNYLDRGYALTGYAASVAEKELFAKWDAFSFTNQYVTDIFGFAPSPEQFQWALQSQHFDVYYDSAAQTWYVTPPIFRFDIIHPIDILEDYLVVTRYEQVQPRLMSLRVGIGSPTKRNALEERLGEYMRAYGARQTIGLLLDSYDNVMSNMRHDTPGQLVRLANAVNKNREYVVDSSLPPLLRNAVHPSAPQPPTAFYLFTETVQVDDENVAHSRWKMGIALVGTEHPFNNAHTLLDALCHHLHLPYTLKRSTSPALIPGRQMSVLVDDVPVGQFGEVHPEVLTNWGLFYPASFIELDLDSIVTLWK